MRNGTTIERKKVYGGLKDTEWDHDRAQKGISWSQRCGMGPQSSAKRDIVVSKMRYGTTIERKKEYGGLKDAEWDHDRAQKGIWWSQRCGMGPRSSAKRNIVVSKMRNGTKIERKKGYGGLKDAEWDHDRAQKGISWSQRCGMGPRSSAKSDIVVSKMRNGTTIERKKGYGGLKTTE
ncbi:MAG: hypothetical protein ACQEV7_22590 [Bacillota bacterium]